MQHSAVGGDEVDSVEREDIAEILEGRHKLLDDAATADNGHLALGRDHDLPHLVVDPDVVDSRLKLQGTCPHAVRH